MRTECRARTSARANFRQRDRLTLDFGYCVSLADLCRRESQPLVDRRSEHPMVGRPDSLKARSSPASSAIAAMPARQVPLLGRQRKLSELAELLSDPGIALLTLTGTGGAGKTSLASDAARRASTDFRDGRGRRARGDRRYWSGRQRNGTRSADSSLAERVALDGLSAPCAPSTCCLCSITLSTCLFGRGGRSGGV
jgi:hypothetical protein